MARPENIAPSKWRRPLPPIEALLERFDYNQETGELKNRDLGRPGIQPGKILTVLATIDGFGYAVSRVIWKIMTGIDPPFIVDHADGDHGNNRWLNLRPATYAQNSQNKTSEPGRSSSGHRGVIFEEYSRRGTKRKKPYLALIYADTKRMELGWYPTLEEAVADRQLAEVKYHGKFRTDRIIVKN